MFATKFFFASMSWHVIQCYGISVFDHPGILLDVAASKSNAATCQYLCSKILVSMPWHIAQCCVMHYSAALYLFLACLLLQNACSST